ncbi:DMT family transporter [Nisaea nitritireducens]|uniref:DMT family transporter n=1 Tax=Nisaea nitritireducens TaxID=568392 RepID=UPI0018678AF8|nr:DMT family transporter [Nisaea nitritireducens]
MSLFLFISTALIWATGAFVTTLQAGIVPIPVSVAYRMLLMTAAMLAVVLVTRTSLRVQRADVPWLVIHATTFFALNFICFYNATTYIPSGVATLALSTSPIFATIIGFLVLKETVRPRAILGMIVGIGGLGLIVAPDLTSLSGGSALLLGMLWALGASFGTAIGTVIGARNHRVGVSAYTTNFWGAFGGALIGFGLALAGGLPIIFDVSVRYIGSLLYLGIAASSFAFLMFFNLVSRIGPGRAAYIFTVVPVIALLISTVLEGVELTAVIVGGTAMILTGNVLVLKR